MKESALNTTKSILNTLCKQNNWMGRGAMNRVPAKNPLKVYKYSFLSSLYT